MKINIVAGSFLNAMRVKGPSAPILGLLGNCITADVTDRDLKTLRLHWDHVIVVPGPAEYMYNANKPYYENILTVRKRCVQNRLIFLDNSSTTIEGVTFIGSTGWNDIASLEKHGLRTKNTTGAELVDVAAKSYEFWRQEDESYIKGAIKRTQSPIVLSHFSPSASWSLHDLPSKWFYGRRSKPVSGTVNNGRTFIAGGNNHESSYSV